MSLAGAVCLDIAISGITSSRVPIRAKQSRAP